MIKRLGVMIAICLWLVACQSSPPLPRAETVSPVPKPDVTKFAYDEIGEHLIDTSVSVSSENNCTETQKTPLADFEEQRLDPETVSAGEQFTHHLVYTVCDPDRDHIINGTLYRNIYLKGRLLHSEPKTIFLKPGRWAINALIEVPAKTKPGIYTLKTEFIGKAFGNHKIKLIKQTDFEVQGSYPSSISK